MRQIDKTRLYPIVIDALLHSPSMRAVARKAGKSVRTIERLMKEPDFDAQYREAKRQLVHNATSKLTASANDAALTLKKIFSDRKATAAARVSAAATTLRLTLEAYELEEIERRISALERQGSSHAKFQID